MPGQFWIQFNTSGYLAAYSFCNHIAQLEMVLNSARSDTLQKIYVKDLGIDLSNISEEKRQFLGLIRSY